MNEENTNLAGNTVENDSSVGTATTQETTEQVSEPVVETKKFTQEQVNEIVRERIDRTNNSIYKRYGVENGEALDNLVGKALSYDILNEKMSATQQENEQMKREIAFVANNIADERREDVEAYFKGKGLSLDKEALKSELETHPEWVAKVQVNVPTTTFTKVSADREQKEETNEQDQVAKLFGLNKLI